MPITSERETAGRAWTPGPWSVGHVSAKDYGGGIIHYEVMVHVGEGPQRGNALAIVCMGGNGATRADAESVKANARLIAAAPELYEALEQAEIAVQELCNDQNPANECWNILRSVRTALSRVEVDHG